MAKHPLPPPCEDSGDHAGPTQIIRDDLKTSKALTKSLNSDDAPGVLPWSCHDRMCRPFAHPFKIVLALERDLMWLFLIKGVW